MRKIVIYGCYIIGLLFNSNISKSQTISVFTGTVISYASFKSAEANATLTDTVNGQYRSLAIDTIGKNVGITWLIENDTIPMQYFIEKMYTTKNFNSTTKKTGKFLNLLTFDEGHYPILVMVSDDLKIIYLYYYWSNKGNSFMKSEKIAVNINSNIELH